VKLFVLNSKPDDPNGYLFQALVRALQRRGDLSLVVLSPNGLQQVRRDPEQQALLVYGGEELGRLRLDRLPEQFGRRAVWFTEDPYEREANQRHAAAFQCVFSNDSGSLEHYSHAEHLPLAGDSALLPLRRSKPPEKLLFFSGTAWPNRKALLSQLWESWPNQQQLDLHLVANAVVEAQAQRTQLANGLSLQPPIAISEFGLRAANSLCTLVIGRDFSGSGAHRFARSPGPRLFEAGLTGSCQLVHAAEIPDMPANLEEGIHFLRFSSLAQLRSLLEQAHTDPTPFLEMGAAMAAVIREQHSYDQRAEQLVQALRQCPTDAITTPRTAPNWRVLFISHEQTKPGFQHGGAGLCLDHIVAAAPASAELRILCRAGDDGHRFDLLDRWGQRVGGFRCQQRVDEFSLHHPELEQHLETVLNSWQPQLVHVNHLLGFTPAVLPLARQAGAQTLITLHDYFSLCDSWNLLDAQQRFCGITTFFDGRCEGCTHARRPQFQSVDPLRRRVVMAEALAHAHRVIVPSEAADQQLRTVMPHLPPAVVIAPTPAPTAPISPATGEHLVALVPGNLAVNKGYLHLREVLQQVQALGLPIRFRVLGRVEAWIEAELAAFPCVELLGRYTPDQFSAKAAGSDLALFLSPWPETYCITFEEWKSGGRACLFYALGALGEPQRQRGLHPASRGLTSTDPQAIVQALLEACTPGGLLRLRQNPAPLPAIANHTTPSSAFGEAHWQLFQHCLADDAQPWAGGWTSRPHQGWVQGHQGITAMAAEPGQPVWRRRVVRLIYGCPGGWRVAALWRRLRGR